MELREYLKARCEARRITYRDLSEKLGKNSQFFTNLLNGQSIPNPRKDRVYVDIAKGLAVPLVELILMVERHAQAKSTELKRGEVPPFFPEIQKSILRKIQDPSLTHAIQTDGFSLLVERIIMLSISVLIKEEDPKFRSLMQALKQPPVSTLCEEESTVTYHNTAPVRGLFMAIMAESEFRTCLSKLVDCKEWTIEADLRLRSGNRIHSDATVSFPYPRTRSLATRFIRSLADDGEEQKQVINDFVACCENLSLDQLKQIVYVIQQVAGDKDKTAFLCSQLEAINTFMETKAPQHRT